jgi:hypothetical protein
MVESMAVMVAESPMISRLAVILDGSMSLSCKRPATGKL